MEDKFDKQFPNSRRIFEGGDPYDSRRNAIKSFIRLEIELEVSKRKEKTVEMVKNILRARMTDPLVLKKDIKAYEDIINLIISTMPL